MESGCALTASTNPPIPRVTVVTRYGGVAIAVFQTIVLPLLDRPVWANALVLAGGMMAIGEAYRLDVRKRNGGSDS